MREMRWWMSGERRGTYLAKCVIDDNDEASAAARDFSALGVHTRAAGVLTRGHGGQERFLRAECLRA